MHLSRPSRALAAALLASLTLAAACSDDASTSSTSTTAPTSTTAAAADASPTAFCTAAGDLLTALNSDGDPSSALAAAVEAAPGDVGDHLSQLGEKFGAAAQAGDDDAFLADDLRSTAATALGDIASTCDYQTTAIDGTEYAFDGLPSTLEPGQTALHLTNTGEQVHEMLLYRAADGTTGDLVDVVNDDPTVSDGRLDEVGVALPAAPGEESVLLTDLTPGSYVMVCFIPVGTTTIDQVRAGENANSLDDHRSQGMISTFTVG